MFSVVVDCIWDVLVGFVAAGGCGQLLHILPCDGSLPL